MHGYCLSLLADHLQPGMRVLDVGSGSGYLTAIMALLVGEKGRVVGVEHIPELVERSLKAISKGKAGQLLESGSLTIHCEPGPLSAAMIAQNAASCLPHCAPCVCCQQYGLKLSSLLWQMDGSGMRRMGPITPSTSEQPLPPLTGMRHLRWLRTCGSIYLAADRSNSRQRTCCYLAIVELPQELVDQLRPGGRMVVPVGSIFQDLEVVDKEQDGTVRRHSAMGVRYVPLTARDRQLANV
eukprot:SM000080S22958  [mRNA]  locus=s80:330642:332041:- [translate_table: standard]